MTARANIWDPSNLIYICFKSNNMKIDKNKTNLSLLKECNIISLRSITWKQFITSEASVDRSSTELLFWKIFTENI